jgi:hypothetical protein
MRYLPGTIHISLISLISLAVAAPAHAQGFGAQDDARRPAVAIMGGASQYDLSGTGTRAFGGVRAHIPLRQRLLVEPGVTYMNYRLQGTLRGPVVTMWFPEVQLQAELPVGGVRPYVGLGGGIAVESLLGERGVDPTASMAAGVRIPLPGGWGIGGEMRVRAVDPFAGTTADWGVLLSRRL